MKKFESTKKIPLNSILRVYKKKYGYSNVKVIDENEFYFGVYADIEFACNVKEGDIIEAYYWIEGAVSYEFNLEIIGRLKLSKGKKDIPRVIFFRHTDKIIRNKERKCLMAKVNIPIKFFTFDTGEESKKISTEKISFQYGTVIELSDREAIIRNLNNPPAKLFLKGHFVINDRDIELVGRAKPIVYNKEKLYSMTFFRISEEDRERLLDYVFSVYRE